MFSAACYAFMDRELKEDLLVRSGKGCEGLGGTIRLREMSYGPEAGYTIEYGFPTKAGCVSAGEAGEALGWLMRDFDLSPPGRAFVMAVFSDIVGAEAKAHGVGVHSVHLHEIGRPAGLFNMAAAGLCYDLLDLGGRNVIGSSISVGRGEIRTEHGRLSVPTPASSVLLSMLKSRPGPFEGEMATPSGIAIVRNLVTRQTDKLPAAGRQGLGFGGRTFEGGVGRLRVFERADQAEGEG
jgi:uncharacterized protein (DUF111 family)